MAHHLSSPIIIIGAGVAGLACARVLRAAGVEVVIIDKGRGPGGRLSTRRIDWPDGPIRFDHGAQYFTARDPAFQTVVAELSARGHVLELEPGAIGQRTASGWQPGRHRDALHVGAPGMNGLVQGLARDLPVQWGTRASRLDPAPDGGVLVQFEDGTQQGPFAAAVIAVPAEQVADLAGAAAPALAGDAREAVSAPCWAYMALAEGPPPDLPYPAFSLDDGGPLALVSREDLRPGRTGPPRFVAHASTAWSQAHLELDATEAAGLLGEALAAATGARLQPGIAHRWRYAQITRAAQTPFFWNSNTRIGACGDWRIGPRIECAWQSGTWLGQAMLASAT